MRNERVVNIKSAQKMKKDLLEKLDAKALAGVIKYFGNINRFFHSEAQFQFELAWRLQESYDCKANLEDLTVLVKGDKKKGGDKDKIIQKMYTDIVLENNNYRVAIELKYKTASFECHSNGQEIHLFRHGAADLGRFDYLMDVNRLELLVYSEKAMNELELLNKFFTVKEIEVKKKCNKAFAVLLTNESAYWEKSHKTTNLGKNIDVTMDYQFRIGANCRCGCGRLYSKKLCWYNSCNKDASGSKKYIGDNLPKTVKGTFRGRTLQLMSNYSYKWNSYLKYYSDSREELFKFVIIEVSE